MDELPDLFLGHDLETGDDIVLPGLQRYRGTLLYGQPGLGKSEFQAGLILQDIEAGRGVLVVDPHDNISKRLLPRIPASRVDDVVLLSLVPGEAPMWPLLDIAQRDDEVLLLADLLVDAWRAQHGVESIGPRASSMLAHALKLLPPAELSPVELLAALSFSDYRESLLDAGNERSRKYSLDFPLEAYWRGTHGALREKGTQEWASAIENKLSVLVTHDWLRRATAGTPVALDNDMTPRVGAAALTEWDLTRVVWVRDNTLVVRRRGDERNYCIRLADKMDGYLLDYLGDKIAISRSLKDGVRARGAKLRVDVGDPSLTWPSPYEEMNNGEYVVEYVRRRRRRRAYSRFADLVLRPKGVEVKEAIDLSSMLDDGKIVLVEIPAKYGTEVMRTVATFVLVAATIRGLREIGLPEERRPPVAVYVDEAELFLSAGVEDILDQLRKGKVALTLAVQRLGQLGGRFGDVRKAVVDSVGTLIALTPGRDESKEISDLIEIPREDLLRLPRGEAFIAMLNRQNWSHEKTRRLGFDELPPAHNDMSMAIRQASIDRYYQTQEEADEVFSTRVHRIGAMRRVILRRSKTARGAG